MILKKKISYRKIKILVNCSLHRYVLLTTASPLQYSKIEILKETFLDIQIKMLSIIFLHRVGAFDTSASPVRHSKIEILEKKIFDQKIKILKLFCS